MCSEKHTNRSGPPILAKASTRGQGPHGIIASRAPDGAALRADFWRLMPSVFRSRAELAAENLFRRKPLACYLERQVRPHRTDNASRIALVALPRLIEWRDLLTIVCPVTLVRWHLPRPIFARTRDRGGARIGHAWPKSSAAFRVHAVAMELGLWCPLAVVATVLSCRRSPCSHMRDGRSRADRFVCQAYDGPQEFIHRAACRSYRFTGSASGCRRLALKKFHPICPLSHVRVVRGGDGHFRSNLRLRRSCNIGSAECDYGRGVALHHVGHALNVARHLPAHTVHH